MYHYLGKMRLSGRHIAQLLVVGAGRVGQQVFEFTNRGDHAYQIFSELAQAYTRKKSTVILGAGSIVDAPTAAIYINSGANFIVGPFFNPEVAKLCNRRKVAYLPGCATMAEISNAEEAGVEIVKLFPRDLYDVI